jgi:two-component system OmpR family sensor kinase
MIGGWLARTHRLVRTRRVRRWGHWTLRTRLGLALVLLAGVALVAANATGVLLLRSYLTDKVDDQLMAMSRPLERAPPGEGAGAGSAARAVPQPRWPFGPDVVIYFYDADGVLVDQSASGEDLTPPALESFPALAARTGTGPYTVDGDDPWRAIVVSLPEGGLAVTAASLADVDETVDSLIAIDAAVMAGVLVVVGLVAAWVVRVGMVPLTRMEGIAIEITAGDLSRRVEDTDPHTEPGRLGVALNTMLGRIESEVAARSASEGRLRRFVADASHELRTPLTSIRGFAELYRRGGAPPGPLLDETMSRIEDEAARMGLLVDELILLARLDRQRPLERRRVDLLAIAADTVRDAHAQAPRTQA